MEANYSEARKALNKLSELAEGRPSFSATAAAHVALAVVAYYPPSITATPAGGVQFEWHVGGVDIDFAFNADGKQVFD